MSGQKLAIFSSFLDGKIDERLRGMSEADVRAELLLMHRVIKVSEEVGEVVDKLIGMTGANPRKGTYATAEDVVDELIDAAVSILGAAEHVLGNEGYILDHLAVKIGSVYARAGLGRNPDVSGSAS